MSDLTADQIFAADDLTLKPVEVPEWGGTVYVRPLGGDERDAYEASMTIQKGPELESNPVGMRARLVVRGVTDANGVRLFKDNDAPRLGQKNAAVLDRLFDEIAELSGLSASSVEDAEKNSESDPSDASTSSEPSPQESPSLNGSEDTALLS